MSRISIVPFDNLVKIYSDSHHTNDMEALKHLESAYEHGMIDIIKELAFTQLLKYENDANNQLHNHDLEKDSTNAFNYAISLCNNKEQESSLLDFETAFNRLTTLESEKHFIDGFISGYKFIKRIKHYDLDFLSDQNDIE